MLSHRRTTRGRKWDISHARQERGRAKVAIHISHRKGYTSIFDGWNNDDQYRESRTDDKVTVWDILGSNDHTHHCSKEQRDRCKQFHILKMNTGGRGSGCRNSHHPEFYSAVQERHLIPSSDPFAPPSFSKTDSQQQQKSQQQHRSLLKSSSSNLAERDSWRGGGPTTASGILGHLGAKINGARHSRKVMFFFSP